ncbi:hypothetical protein [Amaricoccus sp.]|mgnify:CR=1 FL=1|uniref:hypothetical protein n=1 Tax=Amaricoccus sp. TaxID=1872485 RepID=UPI002C963B5E|nr:hypothetical protein [Amaricoccus sp.]HMQ95434.1 hypothetical protein [Amaricoccus sp.]HMR37800.1 hypothetical protein [Paracoccus sp. (in: a-proteobacteria)]
MAKSILAAVHDAMLGDAVEPVPEGAEPGAPASDANQKESAMSKDDAPAGGDKKPGISQAEHDAAVTAASETGKAEGAKAESDRLAAALGAEGVKGDGGRMAAALDLAIKSPGMSGADVAAFVVANVSPTKAADTAASYEQQRLAAAGPAAPSAPAKKATIDTSAIYASRRKQNQEG